VEHLLKAGLQAGQFEDLIFRTWPDQRISNVIERIREEWLALGTDPSIGDIAWFWLPR
jgi:hypothetical protein